MILVISTCSQRLNENEFVRPIEKLLKNDFDTKHYSQVSDVSKYDKVIICGTALKDFEYLKDLERFSWIRNYDGKLLGICSGMQIIASIFRLKLEDKVIIGNKEVVTAKKNLLINGKFKAYFLISKKPVLNNEFVSLTEDDSLVKQESKEIYGCSFHPEVLNQELIVNFCRL